MAEAAPDEVVEIVLERGNHEDPDYLGLGFNIRGGVDIPFVENDSGIFVTKIREDGAAYLDGRLREGDKILEINGFSLDRVTHNEAVQHFVNAGETVTLKVIQGAEDAILQRRESEGVSPQNSDSYLNEDPSGTGNGSGGTLTLIVGSLFLAGILATGAFLYSRRR
ncbi:synaptojanin-2-binding protein-like isoform X1 [Crassostrea virginica]